MFLAAFSAEWPGKSGAGERPLGLGDVAPIGALGVGEGERRVCANWLQAKEVAHNKQHDDKKIDDNLHSSKSQLPAERTNVGGRSRVGRPLEFGHQSRWLAGWLAGWLACLLARRPLSETRRTEK